MRRSAVATVAAVAAVVVGASASREAAACAPAAPEGTDEVCFARAPHQVPATPPPVVVTTTRKVPVPIDLIVGLGVALVVVRRRARRA